MQCGLLAVCHPFEMCGLVSGEVLGASRTNRACRSRLLSGQDHLMKGCRRMLGGCRMSEDAEDGDAALLLYH